MAAENASLLNTGMVGASISTTGSGSETVKPDDASGTTGHDDPNGNGNGNGGDPPNR